LSIRDSSGWVLAVDIGASKVDVALVESDGLIGERARIPTPGDSPLDERVVDLIGRVVDRGAARPGVIGVSCAGPMTGFSERGATHVSPLNIEAWRNYPLAELLESAFDLPTHVDNDGKALAMAEHRWGGGREESSFVAMVVSTGVGGGIILNGAPLDGNHGNAGHLGHIVVERNGVACACGGVGCVEAEASGMAIERRTGSPASQAPPAERRRCGELVGTAVASLANLLDLRLALVAGSVALGFGREFFDAAQAQLDRHVGLDFARGARIVPGGLGADGPLLGAAAVALYRGRP
jgi:glucokinase